MLTLLCANSLLRADFWEIQALGAYVPKIGSWPSICGYRANNCKISGACPTSIRCAVAELWPFFWSYPRKSGQNCHFRLERSFAATAQQRTNGSRPEACRFKLICKASPVSPWRTSSISADFSKLHLSARAAHTRFHSLHLLVQERRTFFAINVP